ncbi:hypothetical protein [Bacillus testis]|uniref:hypothetical protein n=1 Tax=Bacillus testis TaxID=1622072 RepID=UPI00067F6203|nr:hypothetical protein [Bacillus testis]
MKNINYHSRICFLKNVKYANDDWVYIWSNKNKKLYQLPKVCNEIIDMFHENHTIQELESKLLKKGIKTDILAFANQCLTMGIAEPCNEIKSNNINKTKKSFFISVGNILTVFILSLISILVFSIYIKSPVTLMWYFSTSNILLSFILNVSAFWILAYIHEIGHLLALRQFGITSSFRAGKSKGNFGLFTDVTGMYALKSDFRKSVLLAGILSEAVIILFLVIFTLFFNTAITIAITKIFILTYLVNLIGQFRQSYNTDLSLLNKETKRRPTRVERFIDWVNIPLSLTMLSMIFGISIYELLNSIREFNPITLLSAILVIFFQFKITNIQSIKTALRVRREKKI